MKPLFTLLLVFVFSSELHAKVLTVSNRPGATAQYKTVTAAITAAAVNDTIYIHGSETSYGSFTVNKKLTFIGPGHNPKTTLPLAAIVTQVLINAPNAAASGSAFIGLTVSELRCDANTSGQDAITIRRCSINSYISADGNAGTTCTNWIIENNIVHRIYASTGTNASNFIIRNNIINGGTIFGALTSVITNNLFLGGSAVFSDVKNALIQNNIFQNADPVGASSSTFNNNITFAGTATALPYGTNSGTANQVGVNPLFTKYTTGGFTYDHDFHLRTGSPGKNAGTDGTDIGLYGGLGYSETGEPPIPVVRSFTIQNGVVAPGGKLKIQVKAEAKN